MPRSSTRCYAVINNPFPCCSQGKASQPATKMKIVLFWYRNIKSLAIKGRRVKICIYARTYWLINLYTICFQWKGISAWFQLHNFSMYSLRPVSFGLCAIIALLDYESKYKSLEGRLECWKVRGRNWRSVPADMLRIKFFTVGHIIFHNLPFSFNERKTFRLSKLMLKALRDELRSSKDFHSRYQVLPWTLGFTKKRASMQSLIGFHG